MNWYSKLRITFSGNQEGTTFVEVARSKSVKVIGLTGRNGGKLKDMADLTIIVPSNNTSRIQEAHITIGHIICDLVERELFNG